MFMGEKAPTFTLGAYSFTESDDVYYLMTKYEQVSVDIIKPAPIARKNKIIPIGNYVRHGYRFFNKTLAEITALKALRAQTINFAPHSDFPLVEWSSLVEEVKEEIEDNLASRYTIDITVRSKFFQVYPLNIFITLLTPSALTYLNGNVMNITWTDTNISATEPVKIELYKNGVYVSTMTSSTLNTGSYNWIIAAYLEGSDYQVKITVLRDTSIYVLSSNLEINYNGYVSPNGINQYASIPLTTLGNTFTIAFEFADWDLVYGNNGILVGVGGTPFGLYGDYGTNKNIVIRSGNITNDAFESKVKITNSTTWQQVIITVDVLNQVCKMYFNSTEDPLVYSGGTAFEATAFSYLKLFMYRTTAYTSLKFRNLLITSSLLGDDQPVSLYPNSIASITDKEVWYKCNEQSGSLIDYSGNGKDATVYNGDEAFYNQYPEFRKDENNECVTDENHEPQPIL